MANSLPGSPYLPCRNLQMWVLRGHSWIYRLFCIYILPSILRKGTAVVHNGVILQVSLLGLLVVVVCTTAKCRNNAKCHNQRKMSQNIACLTQNVTIAVKCHNPNAKCRNISQTQNVTRICMFIAKCHNIGFSSNVPRLAAPNTQIT